MEQATINDKVDERESDLPEIFTALVSYDGDTIIQQAKYLRNDMVWVLSNYVIRRLLNREGFDVRWTGSCERRAGPDFEILDGNTILSYADDDDQKLHEMLDDYSLTYIREIAERAEEFVRKHLAGKLYNGMLQLFEEATRYALQEELNAQDRVRLERIASFAGQCAALPVRGRGGNNREANYDWTDEDLIRFAMKVDMIRGSWKKITDWFREQGYDSGCIEAIKSLSWFKSFAAKSTSDFSDLLILVLQKKHTSSRELSPAAFTFEHARRECGIPYEYKFDSLNSYYKHGKRIQKEQRR